MQRPHTHQTAGRAGWRHCLPHRRRLGVGALAVLASVGTGAAQAGAASCAGAGDEPLAATRDQSASALVCVLNQERRGRGLPRLRESARLERVATGYAGDMVAGGFFSHTSPQGATMADRLRASGYFQGARAWWVGETLAWGTGSRATPAAIVAAWLDSPPHRRVLLDRRYRELGVGLALGVPVPDTGGLPGATYAAELGVRP